MNIVDINTLYGFYPCKKIDVSQKKLLSIMVSNNISQACTLSLKGALYDYREGNEDTFTECSGISELIPVATIDPRKTEDVERDVKEIIGIGYKAVRLFPELQGWNVEYISAQKVLKALDAYGIPLIINELPSNFLKLPFKLSIPVIFLSAHYYKLHEVIAVFKERDNFYAEARQLISPDAIEYFVEKIGADRLVFGSNTPFEYIQSSILRILYSDIKENEKQLIFSENIKRIVG